METETTPENQEPTADVTKMDTNEGETPEGDKAAAAATQPSQPKQIVKAVDLQVESKTSSFTQPKIQELTEREVSLLFFFQPEGLKEIFKNLSFCRLVFDQLITKRGIASTRRMH
jgi:hypothetical protein